MIDDTGSLWEDPRLTQRPAACPSCGSPEVKVIFWGMPAGDPGPDYVLGGCMVSDDDPTWACAACDHAW